MNKFAFVFCLCFAFVTFSYGQVVSDDFETDTSANYSVLGYGGATLPTDYMATFLYDYSTWTAAAGQTGPASIPIAPNSGGITTHALKMEVNNQDPVAEPAALSVFPLAAAGLSNYSVTFDLWMSYNGGPTGAFGSTEFFILGGHSDAGQVEWSNASNISGFHYCHTGDGGASTYDYRYYESQAAPGAWMPTSLPATPNWNGANETNESATGWSALFAAPPYKLAGAAGHAWTEVEMIVNGSSVTVAFTPSGGSKTTVGTWTCVNGATSGYPFVGYADLFTSVENPVGDNFALVDNLVITDLTPVDSCDLY